MRIVVALQWGAAALAGLAVGCSAHTNSTMGVAEPQAQVDAPTAEQRAHELVQAAQIQVRDLEDIRAASTDLPSAVAIDRHIVAVSRQRDAVLADLGEPQSPRLGPDLADLQRAMRSAAAAQPQAPDRPPILQRDRGPGGMEALPPAR
jgi:hypothetical protein